MKNRTKFSETLELIWFFLQIVFTFLAAASILNIVNHIWFRIGVE